MPLSDFLPGGRTRAKRRLDARPALGELERELHELARDLTRLAGLSAEAGQDDAAAVARESTITARLLEELARGEQLARRGEDQEILARWRALAAAVSKARLLGQGPHRVAKLQAAAKGLRGAATTGPGEAVDPAVAVPDDPAAPRGGVGWQSVTMRVRPLWGSDRSGGHLTPDLQRELRRPTGEHLLEIQSL